MAKMKLLKIQRNSKANMIFIGKTRMPKTTDRKTILRQNAHF